MAMIVFPMENESDEKAINDLKGFYGMYCYSYRIHGNKNGFFSLNHTFLWLIVPQILNGLAQLLVHMTTLEFICAQAPHTMQGLLIGLWYAIFSIQYLVLSTIDHSLKSQLSMLVYQAVRCFLVMVSLVKISSGAASGRKPRFGRGMHI